MDVCMHAFMYLCMHVYTKPKRGSNKKGENTRARTSVLAHNLTSHNAIANTYTYMIIYIYIFCCFFLFTLFNLSYFLKIQSFDINSRIKLSLCFSLVVCISDTMFLFRHFVFDMYIYTYGVHISQKRNNFS